jgi:SNF2 family DNA or RNA helicase|tara:strand:- start:6163 stop:7701 length:1539 start_codon:yes stop_codon:yes gene_type:complete
VTFIGTLYPFQEEAHESMCDRGQMMLCMVMGAGKTPTTIAALETLFERDEITRALLVVPASLKYQWLAEIKKFSSSRAVVIDGPPKARETLWRAAISCQYVVVNAEMLQNDVSYLDRIRIDAIVIDEATLIKSPAAKRSRFLKKIGKRSPYRFALTGQPIENRPEELFSIMEFVDPTILGRFDLFDRTFIVRDRWGKPTRYRNLNHLHESLSDVMYRKTREDIQDQLPELITKVVPVAFDVSGAKVYRMITADLLKKINEAIGKVGRGFDLWRHYNSVGGEAQGDIMSRMTVLRMLCDNPELVRESARLYNEDGDKGSAYADHIVQAGWLTAVPKSPKLDAAVEYIKGILEEDPANKVVVFSFFRQNLRILDETLSKFTTCTKFMGGMSSHDKEQSKKKFSEDPNTRVFLSSDAGGYGVDLPMANHLISYDLPWSAGKLDQRESRIIRLSSEFPHVTVTSFVMRGSIEERQYDMLQEKRLINRAFIDKGYDARGQYEITLGSLSDFMSSAEV